jgi:mannose-6-phosphate isomerase-like protein (cupin superfamily)
MDFSILQYGTEAKIIDENGLDHSIVLSTVDFYIAEGIKTVKVEGMENYYTEYKPHTVHMFIAPEGAPSFPEHQDPTDLIIKCIEGTKTIEVNGELFKIKQGESIHIPANVPHRATNEYASITLSIGD